MIPSGNFVLWSYLDLCGSYSQHGQKTIGLWALLDAVEFFISDGLCALATKDTEKSVGVFLITDQFSLENFVEWRRHKLPMNSKMTWKHQTNLLPDWDSESKFLDGWFACLSMLDNNGENVLSTKGKFLCTHTFRTPFQSLDELELQHF